MVLKHAILEATVPNANGTQDFTSPAITAWNTTGKGLALVFISGDTGAPTAGGWACIGACDFAGRQRSTNMNAPTGSTGLPENHQADVSDMVGVILSNFTGTAWGQWARVQFHTALANGVRLNWVDTSGIGSRVFKIVVVLLEGLGDVFVFGNTTTGHGFTGDAVLTFAKSANSFSTWPPTNLNANECCAGLGGALRLTGVPQQATYVTEDRNADPLNSRGRRSTVNFAAGSQGLAVENLGTLTAFASNGISITGDLQCLGVNMKGATGPGDFAIAQEDLDGGTGTKVFTNLGQRCNLILGLVTALTTEDTLEADSATLARFAFFLTDGATTISFGFAERHTGTVIAAGNPTFVRSFYTSGAIHLEDDTGATLFHATVSKLTSSGLDLAVSTGLSGSLQLFGFGTAPVVIYPDPVVIPLAVPSVQLAARQTPDPVVVPIAAPAVTVLLPTFQAPSPVQLGLEVPAVTLSLPTIPGVELPPPPLAEWYCQALLDLLPRGLAWTREPDSVLARLLCAFAEELARVEFRGLDVLREADVRTTLELLDLWEEWLRTRETCPEDLTPTTEQRRFACVVRLTEPGGQNAYHYAQVAQRLGFNVQVEDFEELREFRAGISVAGDPLSNGEWRFVVIVHAPVQTPLFARAGLASAGDPIATGSNQVLVCELDRLRPAHVLFVYSFDKPYTGFAPWNIVGPAPVVVPLVVPIPRRI